MPDRNRELGSNQSNPMPEGFNPGEADDLGYIRVIDGHAPMHLGLDAVNRHVPSAPDMDWDNAAPTLPCD